MHVAASANNLEVIEYLLDLAPETINRMSHADLVPWSCGSHTPLQRAFNQIITSDHDISAVRLLLSRGANPNTIYHNGESFLHIACDAGHVELVKLLLEHPGFNHNLINAPNNASKTPLQLAGENHEIAALLVQHGATLVGQSEATSLSSSDVTESQSDASNYPAIIEYSLNLSPDTINQITPYPSGDGETLLQMAFYNLKDDKTRNYSIIAFTWC